MRIYVSWIENIDVCDRKRPYAVIDDRKGNVFVSDIFLFQDNLLFSYNLWYLKLTADRKNVANHVEYFNAISTVFGTIPDDMLINRVKSFFHTNNSCIILFKPDKNYLELTCQYYRCGNHIKRKFTSIVHKLYGNNVYVLYDSVVLSIEQILRELSIIDIKVIASSKKIFDLPNVIDKISEVADREFSESKNRIVGDLNIISLFYRIVACLMLRFCYYMSYKFKPPQVELYIETGNTCGWQTSNALYIGVKRIVSSDISGHEYRFIETFLHEYSHYIGGILYGDAPDISIEFEKAYARSMSYYIHFVQKDRDYIGAIRRGLYIMDNTRSYINKLIAMKPLSYHVEKLVNSLFVELRSMGFDVDLPYMKDYMYQSELTIGVYGVAHPLFTIYIIYKWGEINENTYSKSYEDIVNNILYSSVNSHNILLESLDTLENEIKTSYKIPSNACIVILYPDISGWFEFNKAGYKYRIITGD